jgi:hypothetical protein
VSNDLVGPIDPAGPSLHLTESINQNEREQSEGNDGECEKPDEQFSICGCFQYVSQSGPSAMQHRRGAHTGGVFCNSA